MCVRRARSYEDFSAADMALAAVDFLRRTTKRTASEAVPQSTVASKGRRSMDKRSSRSLLFPREATLYGIAVRRPRPRECSEQLNWPHAAAKAGDATLPLLSPHDVPNQRLLLPAVIASDGGRRSAVWQVSVAAHTGVS